MGEFGSIGKNANLAYMAKKADITKKVVKVKEPITKKVVPSKTRPKKNYEVNPLKPSDNPKPFTSTYQPDPEKIKLGWQKIREKRLLTQGIIAALIEADGTPKATLKEYYEALLSQAKLGNSKCVDVVNAAIEVQEALKVEMAVDNTFTVKIVE